jgi:hypothetical protein
VWAQKSETPGRERGKEGGKTRGPASAREKGGGEKDTDRNRLPRSREGGQERMSSFIVNKVTKVLGVDQDQDDDDVNTPLKRGKVSMATAPTLDPHLLPCLQAKRHATPFFPRYCI